MTIPPPPCLYCEVHLDIKNDVLACFVTTWRSFLPFLQQGECDSNIFHFLSGGIHPIRIAIIFFKPYGVCNRHWNLDSIFL